MEMPNALKNLAESLKYAQSPYNLLLTSTISLTPEVLRAICGSDQWDIFSDHLRGLAYTHRINLLKHHLNVPENVNGYQSLVHIIEKRYFSTILTTNLDSALEDILLKSSPAFPVLVIGRDRNEHIATALDNGANDPRIIKLHGNLRDGELSRTYPDFVELKETITRGLARHINQDIVIIGSIEREYEIAGLLNNTGRGSIYYAIPDTHLPNDAVTRIIRARGYDPNNFVIYGYFGQFETFCKALESLLDSKKPQTTHEISPARNQPVKPFEPAPPKTPAALPAPQQSLPATRQQAERSEKQINAPQKPRHFPLIRWIVFGVCMLLIVGGTILIILSIKGIIDNDWSSILGAILAALGAGLTLYFGVFPLSPLDQSENEPSGQPLPVPSGGQSLDLEQAQQAQQFQDVEHVQQQNQQVQQAQQAQQIQHVDHLHQYFYPYGEPASQPSATHEPHSPLPDPVQSPPPPVSQPPTTHKPPSSSANPAQTQTARINEPTRVTEPGQKKEDSVLQLSPKSQNDKIKLTNQLYKQVWQARGDVTYAATQFDKGKTVSDQQYDRLGDFLSELHTPLSDLLATIELLPEKILSRRFPLRNALYRTVAVIAELRSLMSKPNRAALSQEIQQKFLQLSSNIGDITTAFGELCTRFQDETWPTG